MTLVEAHEVVHQAMLTVHPEYMGRPNGIAGSLFRVEQRGQRFDVILLYAGHLFDEFAAAIHTALGESCASIRELQSSTREFTKPAPAAVMGPTIHNYGSVGVQQFGNHNTAHVNQQSSIDQRSIHQTMDLVREHLPEFPDDQREEVQHHLETISGELDASNPRASRMKTALGAIRRVVTSLATVTGKAALETAIETAMKTCLGNCG